MIARALMRVRPLRAAVRWLAGDPPERSYEQRIADGAERLMARGYNPVSALASAEAVELGRAHGLAYDRIEYDEATYTWWAVYETDRRTGATLKLPLGHATEATQFGVASVN